MNGEGNEEEDEAYTYTHTHTHTVYHQNRIINIFLWYNEKFNPFDLISQPARHYKSLINKSTLFYFIYTI